MDDRTAYEILKLKPGSSLEEVDKRYEHFVKLYKRYLMGERLDYTPKQLAEMKEAYESLLYKRINDEELELLYPLESKSLGHQVLKYGSNLATPFLKKYRHKIIYTLVMLILTFIIIKVINYRPVDLKIAVINDPASSLMENQYRTQLTETFKAEIQKYLSFVQKPVVEFQSVFLNEGLSFENPILFAYGDVDVFVMEEGLFQKLNEMGYEFLPLDFSKERSFYDPVLQKTAPRADIVVDQKTTFYQYICNLKKDNKVWVGVVPTKAQHKEKAMRFLRYVSSFD